MRIRPTSAIRGISLSLYLLTSSSFASGLNPQLTPVRECVRARFSAEVGVVELTGKNDGVRVEEFLRSSGNRRGEPWCAAFITWVLKGCKMKTPASSGGARYWFTDPVKTYFVKSRRGNLDRAQTGDVVGFYYASLGRISHIAFVEQNLSNAIITVEGNTSESGSRDGGGVRRLRRMKRSIYAAANHLGQ